MTEVAHIVTLVSVNTLCGVPVRPGMTPRPLILGAPLITRHPRCEACVRAALDLAGRERQQVTDQ